MQGGWTAGADAYLRLQSRRGVEQRCWDRDGVAALQQVGWRGAVVLTAVGRPEAAAALLVDVVGAGHDLPQRVTLPRGTVEVLVRTAPAVAARLRGGADWEWMWTDTAPDLQPGEGRVVRLDACDHPAVAALLAVASPRSSAAAGDPRVERWVGVRDEVGGLRGALVAAAANEPVAPPVPHLASIATHPGRRGEGLGAAVTSALTRALLAEGSQAVTLGMYSDNAVARRMYARLGFRCDHLFSSRVLVPARRVG